MVATPRMPWKNVTEESVKTYKVREVIDLNRMKWKEQFFYWPMKEIAQGNS